MSDSWQIQFDQHRKFYQITCKPSGFIIAVDREVGLIQLLNFCTKRSGTMSSAYGEEIWIDDTAVLFCPRPDPWLNKNFWGKGCDNICSALELANVVTKFLIGQFDEQRS